MVKEVIKELKETSGNHRVTFSKKEIEKLDAKSGDYLRIIKDGVEDED